MTRNISIVMALASFSMLFVSCKKDSVNSTDPDLSGAAPSSVLSSQVIAVASSVSANGDSVYLVNACDRNSHKDSISFSGLPAPSTTYLNANYSGYTPTKAFSVKNSSGTVTGYVAVVQFNGKPVGLLFDANGAFVRVLEQREGRDLDGPGWHQGGRFDDRGGSRKDSVALSALPSSVTAYYSWNYPQDTLIRALRNNDSSIVVLSSNNQVYVSVFSKIGEFVKRTALVEKQGKHSFIDVSSLPSAAQQYLTTTYPNYVFKQGFKIVKDNVVQGYVVVIDANATKYAIEFDASGGFLKAVTIR